MTTLKFDQNNLLQAPSEADGEQALIKIQEQVEAARQRLHQKALEIGTQYVERRAQAGMGQFSGLTLMVRRRGNSVTAHWCQFHYKKGQRTGINNLPKNKGTPFYGIDTLKHHAPDWLQEIAVETEGRVRPIREALARLIEIEKSLGVIDARVGGSIFRSITSAQVDLTIAANDEDTTGVEPAADIPY